MIKSFARGHINFELILHDPYHLHWSPYFPPPIIRKYIVRINANTTALDWHCNVDMVNIIFDVVQVIKWSNIRNIHVTNGHLFNSPSFSTTIDDRLRLQLIFIKSHSLYGTAHTHLFCIIYYELFLIHLPHFLWEFFFDSRFFSQTAYCK